MTEVWRKVNGLAVRCTECTENREQLQEADGNPVGVTYRCEAKDETCVFLNRKIDGQTWWEDFHDIYKEEPGNEP